jgi:hypothetical protein
MLACACAQNTSAKLVGRGAVHLTLIRLVGLPFTADAHRQNRKRSIVTADEKLTAFFELKGQLSVRMSLAADFNFVTAISTLSSEISL